MSKIITISGQPGSGTTTLSKRLVEQLDATYLNAGSIFRELAAEKGMSLGEFSKHVNENPEIDKMIDYQLRNAVETFLENTGENIPVPPADDSRDLGMTIDCDAEFFIIESRLGGWIAGKEAFMRIWCQAPIEVRCERISNESTRQETRENLLERQSDEAMRYKNWYDINISDLSIYDTVLNTSRWSSESVCEIVESMIEKHHASSDEGVNDKYTPFHPGY